MSKRYKVLVLGGGGYFGLINSIFLSYLGQGYDFLSKIDSISGTSIGGIQACALIAGCDGVKLRDGFIKNGESIFTKRLANKINILNLPFYSNESLGEAIKQFVGKKTLKDCSYQKTGVSVFVPSYNMTKQQMKVFDNIGEKDSQYKLLDIGLFTSAAMFYFPVLQDKGECIVDGGIRQVVPVLTHACGLKNKLGIDFKDMDVFVLCAGNRIDSGRGDFSTINEWGPIDWLTKFLIDDITLSNSCTSKFWGQNLGFGSFEWFNPVQIFGGMDDVGQTDYLLTQCQMYKDLFLKKWEEFLNK